MTDMAAVIEKVQQFETAFGKRLQERPEERRGQAWMNALYEIDPDAYESLTATENDPFYRNDRMLEARKALYNYWMQGLSLETKAEHAEQYEL